MKKSKRGSIYKWFFHFSIALGNARKRLSARLGRFFRRGSSRLICHALDNNRRRQERGNLRARRREIERGRAFFVRTRRRFFPSSPTSTSFSPKHAPSLRRRRRRGRRPRGNLR